MRLVLDTNIFISGIFWEGNFCSQIIDKWRDGKIEMISSRKIIEELIETLKDFKIRLDDGEIESWKNMIIENSMIVEPSEILDIIKEDPEDNKFLETAVEGEADFIISQDKHLLKLKEYNGIKIIKPEDVLKLMD
jgi:hypothetical protein